MPESRRGMRYAWKPDVPDARDRVCRLQRPRTDLPRSVDLRPYFAPVPLENQGSLGSCTANALVSAMEYLRVKVGQLPHADMSRLFVYYNEREMEGTIMEDSGAQIRSGVKSLAQQGVCSEASWPYDIGSFKKKPSDGCYAEAKKHLVTSYARVTGMNDLFGRLADEHPVVFGFSVFESFESDTVAKNGKVPYPNIEREANYGGHAVLAVGYDMDMQFAGETGFVICRNSWGSDWGDGGYFYLPVRIVEDNNMADDFWTITECSFG